MTNDKDKDLARVVSQPLVEHGDLPRPATSQLEQILSEVRKLLGYSEGALTFEQLPITLKRKLDLLDHAFRTHVVRTPKLWMKTPLSPRTEVSFYVDGPMAVREIRALIEYLELIAEIISTGKDESMDSKTLKAGTVVHVHGIPVTLDADVAVSASDGNWALVLAALQESATTTGAGTTSAR